MEKWREKMDIRIKLTDENGETLDRFVVYQDGSDIEGAAFIRKLISEALTVEEFEDAFSGAMLED